MLSLQCPKCTQPLQVDAKFAGQTIRCPKCTQLMKAPAAVAAVPLPPPSVPTAVPTPVKPPVSVAVTAPDLTYDVFVSYRRKDGSETARLVAEKLQQRGYRVFLDVDKLGAGEWSKELEQRILQCPDFVPIITPAYFEDVAKPTSVIRMEVALALRSERNVVPLLATPNPFPSKLPADLAGLPAKNGIKYVHEYAEEAVSRLCTFLKSNPVRGPERLASWDAEALVIVGIVGLLTGTWQGATSGEVAGLGGWGTWTYFVSGFFWSVLWTMVLGVPLVLLLSVLAHVLKVRRDTLYVGVWAPFWAVFPPLVGAMAGGLVGGLFMLLSARSFFWGGVLGGWVGIGLTLLLALTNAWEHGRNVLGFRRG